MKLRANNMNKILKKTIWILNIIAIAFLLLSYLSAWINPRALPMLSIIGYAYPIFLIINILFTIFWAIFKNIRFLYSLITIILGIGIFMAHFQAFNSYTKKEGDIALVTFNMGHNIDKHIPNRASLVRADSYTLQRFLDTVNADIICLQEGQLPFRTIHKMTEKLGMSMASRKYKLRNKSFGLHLITISKYPIISTAELRYNDDIFAMISDIAINDDTIRVINTHLNSNTLSGADIRDVNDIMRLNAVGDGKTVRTIKNISTRFDKNAKIRSKQADGIINNIKYSKYKVIVCGDFNDTPATYSYQRISSGFSDAFMKKGRGWGNTFASNLPWIRIDYVLCGKGLTVEEYKVLDHIKISDHHPIRCLISTN